MLHGNGNQYVETEAYESVKARFKKKIGNMYVLKAYIYIYILKYKILKKLGLRIM